MALLNNFTWASEIEIEGHIYDCFSLLRLTDDFYKTW